MKYTFVLPAYKRAFLKQAIDSILAQTYKDFELIIVDDDSPENLDEIINLYDDSRVIYYKNRENIGAKSLVRQWNYCISLCDSQYLILASDDDVYDPRYLEKMDVLVQKYPDSNVFRPRVQHIDSDGNTLWIGGYLKERSSSLDYLDAWVRGWIGGGIPFYVFRRDKLLEIGGFADYPLAWHSDDATVLRMCENDLISTDEVLFSFRTSGANISSRQNSRTDLLNKVNATNQFYNEVMKYLIGYKTIDEYSACLIRSIKAKLPSFLQYDRINGQLFNAGFADVFKGVKTVMDFTFISKVQLFRRYFIYILRGI